MPRFTIAILVLLASACRSGEDGGSEPVRPQTILQFPEFYGLYAVEKGRPIELKAAGTPARVGRQVEFLLYDRTVSSNGGEWNVLPGIWDRDEGIWKPGTPIRCRLKPIEGKGEMVRMVPESILGPGMYVLAGTVGGGMPRVQPLLIEIGPLVKELADTARAAVKAGDWDRARRWARGLVELDPASREARDFLREACDGVPK